MRPRTPTFIAAFLLLSLTGRLLADGFIYIDPRHWPQPRPPHPAPILRPVPRPEFPLQVIKHRVEARIEDSVARTRVDETFHNPNPWQLEGTYIFPLPPGASVSRFAMTVGGKEVQGEVLERDKARAIYESIVRQSRDPGLLEFVERGLFRARVFPIPAQGNVEVRIDYEESLTLTGGVGRWRYPLNTGKYSAGEYRDVLIDVSLKSSTPLRSVTCASHPASVARPTDREARVVFEARTLQADKDLLLDWNVGEDALAPLLLTHRTHEPEGFFLLSIAPRTDRPKAPLLKDLVAVIDTSGSMAGPKMEEARRALRHFVQSLNPGDRFNLIDFSTEARRFRDGLVELNDESRRAALAYVDGLQARGGTNIEEALRFALGALEATEDDGRYKLVAFITDGEPTVGLTRPEEILKSVRERNGRARRIFAFGVGADLNAQLLERLVQENRGALEYVAAGENLEVKLSSFWDKVDFPVLTDIRLEFLNLAASDLYPKPLPDLFRGEQLAVLGRFREGGRRTVVLRGKFQGEERVFEYALDFGPDAAAGAGRNDHVPRLWATRKIGYLLEQIRLSGESRELKDEVIRLSQTYGVLTPYTSYLILEEGERRIAGVPGAAPAAPLAREALRRWSLGSPAEAGGAGAPGKLGLDIAKRSLEADRGGAAVAGGRDVGALKAGESKQVEEFYVLLNRAERRVQQVGSRAFYLQGERWLEGGLDDHALASARRVAYLSDEYFALLGKHAGIGELLGVGSKVTFRWGGEVIAVE